MQPAIESLGPLQRRLDLSVPAADIEREVTARLSKMARGVSMPGFRKGKVPLKLVAASYGAKVHAEVLNDKVGAALDAAVSAGNLRLAGAPRLEARPPAAAASSTDPDAATELAFTATFEVMPEVKIGDLSATEVRRATCEVGDAEVERTLEIMQRQRVTYAPRDAAARDGDRVTIDFKGSIDGAEFAGGSAENFPLVLGQGRMLPQFEAAVRGMAANESKTFAVAFPADYHGRDLAGKTAQFEVRVRSVEAPDLPPLDAAFARGLGIADGDLVRMRHDVRANLEREVGRRLKARTKDSALAALLGAATFEVPRSLVEREQQQLAKMLRARSAGAGAGDPAGSAGDAGDDAALPAAAVAAMQPQAERRVRLGLLVAELVQSERLQARQDQVRKALEEVAASYERPGEVIQWYLGSRERLGEIESIVTEDNVVAWVLAHAHAIDAPVAFDDLMGHT